MADEYLYLRLRVPTESELGESFLTSTNPNRKMVKLAQFGAMVIKSGLTSGKPLKGIQPSTTETPLPRRRPVRSKAPQTGTHQPSDIVALENQPSNPLDDLEGADLDDLVNNGRTASHLN